MTTSTVDHADYLASPAVTPAGPQLTLEDGSETDDQLIRSLSECRPSLQPDPSARSRYARVLYAITGWTVFREQAEEADDAGYAALAADYAAEDAERRQTARRRPPNWADEDD